MRKTYSLFILLFIIAGCSESAPPPRDVFRSYRVRYVFDGDSFKLENGRSVRLIGVDAPEKRMPLSKEARLFLKKCIEGKECLLMAGRTQVDRYERYLCYAKRADSEELLNVRILSEGLAYAYIFPDTEHKAELIAAQRAARRQKRGVWGLPRKREKYYFTAFGVTHRPGCPRLRDAGHKKRFESLEAALDTGCPPCRTCQP